MTSVAQKTPSLNAMKIVRRNQLCNLLTKIKSGLVANYFIAAMTPGFHERGNFNHENACSTKFNYALICFVSCSLNRTG